MTFLAFPKSHHRKIHSTNLIERFNKEIKRRTKVIGAFPGDVSAMRIIVPLAIDTNAKWMERKYVSWEDSEQENKVDDEFTEIFDVIEILSQLLYPNTFCKSLANQYSTLLFFKCI